MITKFTEYIVESRKSIDELEMLNPGELGKLLHAEVHKSYPNIKYIKDIIAVGCPIDSADMCGRTALHGAANDANFELVELLVSRGADVNAVDEDGYTALYLATECGDVDILKYLISNGANINAETDDGATAWDIADDDVMEKVPQLNPNNTSDLYWAVRYGSGNLNRVESLIKDGALVNDQDEFGYTVLHWAAKSKKLGALRILLSSGAEVNVRDVYGRSAWDYADVGIREALPELNPNK